MKQSMDTSNTVIVKPKILYFGTPVILLSTLNEDGTTNITPMSSAWALDNRIILGLSDLGHGMQNLLRHGACVVNLPSADMWQKVERLAGLTGANPVPPEKAQMFSFEPDKFLAAELTPVTSVKVAPKRIDECPLQIEAEVRNIEFTGDKVRFGIIEIESVLVHAHAQIIADLEHIDPKTWSPLIYNFRHYFGLSEELGKSFRAET